jgi:Zn-dependent protease with chaperone function
LAFLPAFTLHQSAVFSQTPGKGEVEISRVESWFKGKSLVEIDAALTRLRPEAVSQSNKALLMKDLPLVNAGNRIHDERQIGLLRARLDRTLKLFERDQVMELIIFRNPQPIVYTKPGVVLVISTEILKIAGNDDALVGVVAHELAHEYVAMDFLKALQSGNLPRIRELELFCDAVAVVVLLDLGFDPAQYAQVLRSIANYSKAAEELNNGENSHPAVEARLRVIADISALFMSRSAR